MNRWLVGKTQVQNTVISIKFKPNPFINRYAIKARPDRVKPSDKANEMQKRARKTNNYNLLTTKL